MNKQEITKLIKKLDGKIDRATYKLYDLTDEEIATIGKSL